MDAAAKMNRANQLNPYHDEFWNCRGLEKPPHDEIPAATKALWKKDSNPAGTSNKANQLNPYHVEFWRCRGLKQPHHNDIPTGLNALINYYKDCKEYGRKLNPNNYPPLKSIETVEAEAEGGQTTATKQGEEGGGLLSTLAMGLGAAGLAYLGYQAFKEEQKKDKREKEEFFLKF